MAYKIKDYDMIEVLEALDDASLQIVASGTYTDGEGESYSLTVFDNDYFHQNILVNHRSRKVSLWTDDAASGFYALFSSWWDSRKDL